MPIERQMEWLERIVALEHAVKRLTETMSVDFGAMRIESEQARERMRTSLHHISNAVQVLASRASNQDRDERVKKENKARRWRAASKAGKMIVGTLSAILAAIGIYEWFRRTGDPTAHGVIDAAASVTQAHEDGMGP